MLIRNTLIVLAGTLALGTAAAAGLKDKPPTGVKLSGTWRLDPTQSDDPRAVMERAEKEAKQRRDESAEGGGFGRDRPWDRDPTSRDPMDRDPMGRDSNTRGTWGGGRTTDQTRRDPFPEGGTYRRGGSTTIDPTGREASATWGTGGGMGSINNEWLLQLDPSPDFLTIVDSGSRVSVSENKLETECGAGKTEPVADSYGDGERRCGWGGKAWVIETTRGKRFKRSDRFELSKDGRTLTYTTSASGQKMPGVKIARTYNLVPPATPSP